MSEFEKATIGTFYRVDADGTVWSIRHNWRGYGERKVTPQINGDGYLTVRLSLSGKRRNYTVHRLVALFHLPHKPSASHEIRHLDGDRLNPSAGNLEWGTRADNARDREQHGNTAKGRRNGAAKLDEAAVRHIRASAHRSAILSELYDVSKETINNVRGGRLWTHL